MNYCKSIIVTALLSIPAFSFSQSKLAEIGKALQEDTKPKSSSGQSNLAVSDEGKGGTKGSHSSSKTASPPPAGGNGSSNIAVSDEGKGGTKGGKSSSREMKDSGKVAEPKKAESKIDKPKE